MHRCLLKVNQTLELSHGSLIELVALARGGKAVLSTLGQLPMCNIETTHMVRAVIDCEIKWFSDWREYQKVVWDTLAKDIHANNMFLGILENQSTANVSSGENKMAAIYREAELVGAVLETRERFPLFSNMDPSAAEFAVHCWIEAFGNIKGVFGPQMTSVAVAEYLKRGMGIDPKSVMRQMAYELLQVSPPTTIVPGGMRLAERGDFDLLVKWSLNFAIDCRLPEASSPHLREEVIKNLEQALSTGTRFVWEDHGVLKSMAGKTRVASFGTSVSYVYTPPEFRGKGYASHLVAQLSQSILHAGAPRCMLFADADNPTSNMIYQRIGYHHTCDFMMLHLQNE